MTNPDLEDALCDLLDRMETAETTLVTLMDDYGPPFHQHERIRLEGKANGVRLASSYVKEELDRARKVSK